jgi:NitT/TauT family transport system permease protein
LPICFLALWEITALLLNQPLILAPASSSFATLVKGVQEGWILEGTRVTLFETSCSFVITAALGLIVGILLGLNPWTAQVMRPFLTVAWAAPKIVLIPVFLFVFGLGVWSKVGLAVSFGIFPMIAFTMSGIVDVKKVHLKTARVFKLSKWALFWKVLFPSSIPHITVGLRYAFSLCFIGSVIGEMFASAQGLGTQLLQAQGIADISRMLAILIILVSIAVVVNFGFYSLEQHLKLTRGSEAGGGSP